jgi:uncharacterized protein YegL
MSLLKLLPKPLLFALCGALGCLASALPSEAILFLTRSPPPTLPPHTTPKAVCLLIDCSGSMQGSKLREIKKATGRFIERQDFSRHRVAMVSFESLANLLSPLSNLPNKLRSATNAISDGGGTRMDLGLKKAADSLSNATEQRFILLFTDGMPDDQSDTLSVAKRVRADGVTIIAVATGDADLAFDCIVSLSWSLNYCRDRNQLQDVLRRCHRALNHGGRLILQVAHAPHAPSNPPAFNVDYEPGPGGPEDTMLRYRFWAGGVSTIMAEYGFKCASTGEQFEEIHELRVADAMLIVNDLVELEFEKIEVFESWRGEPFGRSISPFVLARRAI